MANDTVIDLAKPEQQNPWTVLLRQGARELLDHAIQAEVTERLPQYSQDKTS